MLVDSTVQLMRYDELITDSSPVASFGFRAVDQFIEHGGIRNGHLAFVVARSGVGKTNFILNVIDRLTTAGKTVLFSSQEMLSEELVPRLMAIRWGVPLREVPMDYTASKETGQGLVSYPKEFGGLYIYERKRPTFDDLKAALGMVAEGTGQTPVVIQDYLHLMTRNGYPQFEQQRIPKLAEDSKVWANENKVPFIQLTQTGRANEHDDGANHGHIPLSMESLMYGGEQAADLIVGLYRPEKNPAWQRLDLEGEKLLEAQANLATWRDKMVVQVPKNRYGEENIGGTPIHWDKQTMRMEEIV